MSSKRVRIPRTPLPGEIDQNEADDKRKDRDYLPSSDSDDDSDCEDELDETELDDLTQEAKLSINDLKKKYRVPE